MISTKSLLFLICLFSLLTEALCLPMVLSTFSHHAILPLGCMIPTKSLLFLISLFSLLTEALCLPMVLSTFSHHAVWHLGINMYVLWSFSRSIGHTFGQEQFLAFYLSAGEFVVVIQFNSAKICKSIVYNIQQGGIARSPKRNPL